MSDKTVAIIAVILVPLVFFTAPYAWRSLRAVRAPRRLVAQRYLVHLDNGPSIEGVLVRRSRSELELADASVQVSQEGVYELSAPRIVVVPVRRVVFMQEVRAS